ncbi:MAG TPA: M28 family peptidase [Candidatus Xenobia bacterium]|jgi:hypothetical protein
MQIKHASQALPLTVEPHIFEVLLAVSMRELQEAVHVLSMPRHVEANPENNDSVRKFLGNVFRSYGYDVQLQGHQFNLFIAPPDYVGTPCLLLGAHYDSSVESPGADDNASGVAVLMACARILQQFPPRHPVLFAFFNAYQQEVSGSAEFAAMLAAQRNQPVREAFILECVGVCADRPYSQRTPRGIPGLPDHGNFLGLLANWGSRHVLESVLRVARTYVPDLPVVGMHAPTASTTWRGDHTPFWRANIPTVLWTDTGEYRNPHHRKPTDTSDRLDYPFMQQVLLLLLSCALHTPPPRLRDPDED